MVKTQLRRCGALLLLAMAGILFTGCGGETETSSASSDTSSKKAVAESVPSNPKTPTAPEFTLNDLKGGTVSLSEYRGHVVLLDFWATWCGPCRRSIPDLKNLYEMHNREGFDVLGVALERRTLDNLVSYVETNAIQYPILVGTADVVGKYGGIRSIPTAFLIGRDGTIRNRFVGVQPRGALEQAILALLAEPPA